VLGVYLAHFTDTAAFGYIAGCYIFMRVRIATVCHVASTQRANSGKSYILCWYVTYCRRRILTRRFCTVF
jgi:hypothetical protein